jgi:[CysO sulfur-carrier protein]-S-L-cysteine hydrolase
MRIARDLLDRIVEHARRDAPNECCGVVSAQGGDAREVFELENVAASPLRFEVGADLVGVMARIDEEGHELGAIYHSHTRTPPAPSPTDVNFSVNWPGVEWIIVGVDGEGETEVRSFRIEDGRVREVELEIT